MVIRRRPGGGVRQVGVGVCVLAAVGAALTGCRADDSGQAPTADPNLVLPLAVGLPRDQEGLIGEVQARSRPGTPEYLTWLTASEIAAKYGAPADAAARVLTSLQAAGFVGQPDPTGSVLVGSMTAGQAEKFFGVRIIVAEPAQGVRVAQPASEVKVPKQLSGAVQEVVGLTLQLGDPQPSGSASPRPPNEVACPPAPGVAAKLSGFYRLRRVPSPAEGGAGVKLAMLSVDQVSQRALSVFGSCFGVAMPPVTEIPVDGSAPSVFGRTAEESTLDVAAASIAAESIAGIEMYRFNPYSSVVFPLAAAVGSSYQVDGPQIISTSVGFCEKDVKVNELDLAEWFLLSASATGTTTLASAGDTGSSGCAPGRTEQAAQYPASSPNVMGIGGTEFSGSGDSLTEQVWNGTPRVKQAGGGTTASGFPRPDYQSGLGPGDARLVPDVAFIAAPAEFGPIPVCDDDGTCRLRTVGGTSATAPGVAGALADVESALAAPGKRAPRLGLLNPTIYNLGRGPDPAGAIHDVTVGDNDLYTTGCCTAAVGYDTASGWGSLRFDALETELRALVPPSP